MHDTTDIIMDYLELPRPIALVLDAAGNIEHLSDDACTLLGYPLADLLGVNWISQCLPSSWQQKTKTIFDSLIHQGRDQSEQYVYPIVSKNGERFIFSWHSEARRDPSGNYIGSITTGIKIRDNALQEKIHCSNLRRAIKRFWIMPLKQSSVLIAVASLPTSTKPRKRFLAITRAS